MAYHPPLAGIYLIENRITGSAYIGQSVDLASRIDQNFRALANGKHHNPLLQSDYEKYGREVFEVRILRLLQREMARWPQMSNWLCRREQYYYWRLRPTYNMAIPPSPRGAKFKAR